ncbi:MAG: hypothetical protein JST26_20945 [Bacteroidetes bacterium]|nr:hypothetical protein [Bacteroidota bacterium]
MARSKTHSTKNYATPGKPMSQAEFDAMIKAAEDGPFMSEKEFKQKFEMWKKSLGK